MGPAGHIRRSRILAALRPCTILPPMDITPWRPRFIIYDHTPVPHLRRRSMSSDTLNKRIVQHTGSLLTVNSHDRPGKVVYVKPLTQLQAGGLSRTAVAIIAGYNVPEGKACMVINYCTRPPERFAVSYDPLDLSEYTGAKP